MKHYTLKLAWRQSCAETFIPGSTLITEEGVKRKLSKQAFITKNVGDY